MSVTINGTNGITFPSGSTQLNIGRVVQVVQGLQATQTTTSSSTYTDTGLTASITPTNSSNKILVMITADGVYATGSTNVVADFQILRGSTSIYEFASAGNVSATSLTLVLGSCSVNYLDSPSTTSSTTYKLQIKSKYGSGTVGVSTYDGKQSITLMEIAA